MPNVQPIIVVNGHRSILVKFTKPDPDRAVFTVQDKGKMDSYHFSRILAHLLALANPGGGGGGKPDMATPQSPGRGRVSMSIAPTKASKKNIFLFFSKVNLDQFQK